MRDVKELEAVKNLNNRIAVEVLGWHRDDPYWYSGEGDDEKTEAMSDDMGDSRTHEFWPAEDMNDAFVVVKDLKRKGYKFALVDNGQDSETPFVAYFDKYEIDVGELAILHGVRAKTASLAICMAALKITRGASNG